MKKKFNFNIQLFADEKEKSDSENPPKETSSEKKEPNPYDDLIKGYQDREKGYQEEIVKLKQQVKDYSDFLKSTPLKTEEPKKSSDELISNLIKGGRYNG